jgi:hypothetical protein
MMMMMMMMMVMMVMMMVMMMMMMMMMNIHCRTERCGQREWYGELVEPALLQAEGLLKARPSASLGPRRFGDEAEHLGRLGPTAVVQVTQHDLTDSIRAHVRHH